MAVNKLYKSEAYLRKRLYRDKKTPDQIAAECGVSRTIIYNNMKKFGLK